MTNCINCGAVLHGNICEYCGTEYNNGVIVANFQNSDYTGVLKIGNEEIPVYIANMKSHMIEFGTWCDCNGVLHREIPKMKREFTLIEF